MRTLRRTSTAQRAWGVFAIVASLVGSLAVAGAVDAVWEAGQATHAASILPTKDVWTEARITTLGSQAMGLVTGDGRALELGLDFNNTSVFQEGGVLNVTHLRLGQQVKVLSGMRDGKAMAQAVEIKLWNVLPGVK